MKRFTATTISVLFLTFLLVPCSEAWYYNDDPSRTGDSPETAYLIDSVENLKILRDRVNDSTEPANKYYRLTQDLDITSEHDWTPIGYDLDSNGNLNTYRYFAGNFDGDGHTIFVSIDKSIRGTTGNLYSGLFGMVGNYHNTSNTPTASITNLNVRGTSRARVYYSGEAKAFAGGIALQTQNKSVIENCTFSGDVSAILGGHGTASAGGIVAWSRGQAVKDCEVTRWSTVSAALSDTTDITSNYAGGIVGWGYGTIITDCTSHARIANADYMGGIAGYFNYSGRLSDYFSGNRYSGALWGIGDEASDEGCTYTPLSVRILTTALNPSYATVGTRYEAMFLASEVKGITWDIISGDLPAGITLGTSGVLSGVPTSADIYSFEVRVSVPDFPEISDKAAFTLAAVNPGTTPSVPTTPNSGGGSGGGGGCSAGFGVSVLGVCLALFVRKGRSDYE